MKLMQGTVALPYTQLVSIAIAVATGWAQELRPGLERCPGEHFSTKLRRQLLILDSPQSREQSQRLSTILKIFA